MKPINIDPEDVGLHDTDSSQLSASTASNSTLPQLEATDAEKAQNEEERRRRAARKEKREAIEKKKEQQRLEDKKQRKKESSKEKQEEKGEKLGRRREGNKCIIK